MNELHAVLDTWRGLHGRDAVLATVVHVTGSAYRRPGARMLVTADRRRIGGVSGGCLESEIARKGWWATASGRPVVRIYDTMSEGDAAWEFGLGCNGIIHILLERVAGVGCAEYLTFLQRHREHAMASVIATVTRAATASGVEVGHRLLVDADGVQGGALVGTDLERVVLTHAEAVLVSQQSVLAHLDGADVFVEWVPPPVSLVVCGAGDDAQPLVAMAQALGWDVTVADGRPWYARPERFPGARVVQVSSRGLLDGLDIDEHSIVVMMTHNILFDEQLLPLLLARMPRYLGILGPRSRTRQLFEACQKTPPSFVHAPVGLDLGGDGPAAIALGIVSEIQSVIACGSRRMLRERPAHIHATVPEYGADSFEADPLATRPATCEIAMAASA